MRRQTHLPVIALYFCLLASGVMYAAWTTPRDWTSGEIVTAAQLNTHLRDNLNALREGGLAITSQAAGDILYASSATQLGRVAGAATGAVLASGGTGSAPAWSRVPTLDNLSFPATQVPSAGANTLDDYEEGSWTPVIGGSGGTSGQVYSSQVGRYVKIGKLCILQFQAVLSTEGTITTSVQIQGFPSTCTAENTSGLTSNAALFYSSLATNWVAVIARVITNTTTADVMGAQAAATTNTTSLTAADINNTSAFEGTFIFRATN